MGVMIAATAAVHTDDGYIADASAAITSALDECGLAPNQVHALINTGLYRESNIVEPAVSALISKAAKIGLEYTTGAVPTFSFDLMNGSCGILNAIQIATALLTTDSASNVVVCSGDEHPSGQFDASFPYTGTAAAMVLTLDGTDAGFGRLAVRSLAGSVPVDGRLDLATMGPDGRISITVDLHTQLRGRPRPVGRGGSTRPDRVATRPRPNLPRLGSTLPGFRGQIGCATGDTWQFCCDAARRWGSAHIRDHTGVPLRRRTGNRRLDRPFAVRGSGGADRRGNSVSVCVHVIWLRAVPVAGWTFLGWGIVAASRNQLPQSRSLRAVLAIDGFLSVVVHAAQIPAAAKFSKPRGYSPLGSALMTMAFGATWYR